MNEKYFLLRLRCEWERLIKPSPLKLKKKSLHYGSYMENYVQTIWTICSCFCWKNQTSPIKLDFKSQEVVLVLNFVMSRSSFCNLLRQFFSIKKFGKKKKTKLFRGVAGPYMRSFPKMLRISNLDCGGVIFLLTFNLKKVSSYRVDNVLMIWTLTDSIALGCAICFLMSLQVFISWSGVEKWTIPPSSREKVSPNPF